MAEQQKAGYWMVKWGNAIRLNTDKTADKVDACRQCYGMATNDMRLKFISTRVADVRSIKFRKKLESDKTGWVSPEIDNKLGMKT